MIVIYFSFCIILKLQVSINDNLPLKLCSICISRLESCHQLIISTIEMNKTLEEVMKKRQIRSNSYIFVSKIYTIIE